MRVCELLSIKLPDLEPHNQVVNVIKAKGSKQRHVTLDPETFALLSRYIVDTHTPGEQIILPLKVLWVWKLVKKYARPSFRTPYTPIHCGAASPFTL